MSLVRWNPVFSRMLAQWPEQWDDEVLSWQGAGLGTGLEVYETDTESVVRANVAGVKEEDIDLTFEKGVLLITAEREDEKEDEKRTHYARTSWEYSYKVAVPGMIDHNLDPEAELKDGVLTIRFQKSKASQPKKLKIGAGRPE